jgi:hypothetical protein
MASKDIYALPSSEVPDLDVKRDVSPTADVESHEKINHVEANMMPAQRRSNLFSMLAGGAGLLADGYQNSLASLPESCPVSCTNVTAANWKRHFQTDLWSIRLYSEVSGSNREWWVFRSVSPDPADRRSPACRYNLGSILNGLRGGPSGAKGRHDHYNAIYCARRNIRNRRPCPIGCWFFLVHHSCSRYGRLWRGRRVSCCIHCRESFFRRKVSQLTRQSIEGAEASFKKHRGFFFMMTTTGCLITGQLLTLIVCLSEQIAFVPMYLYSCVQSSLEPPRTTTPLSPPN